MTATENTQKSNDPSAKKGGSSKGKSETEIARENSPLVKFLDSVGPVLAPVFAAVGMVFKALHWTLSLVFSDKMMKGIDAFFGKILDSIINDEVIGILFGMTLMASVVWSAPDPLRHLGTLDWCRQVEGINASKISRHYRISIERAAQAKGNCLRYKFEGKMEDTSKKALEVDTEKSASDITWDEKKRATEADRQERIKEQALNPKMEIKEDENEKTSPDDYIDF